LVEAGRTVRNFPEDGMTTEIAVPFAVVNEVVLELPVAEVLFREYKISSFPPSGRPVREIFTRMSPVDPISPLPSDRP
jgi:hypothetical protein